MADNTHMWQHYPQCIWTPTTACGGSGRHHTGRCIMCMQVWYTEHKCVVLFDHPIMLIVDNKNNKVCPARLLSGAGMSLS